MDAKSLDFHLRRLTDHEKRYREGYQNPYLMGLKTLSINGTTVTLMPDSTEAFDVANSPIIIKKHSRFQTYPLHVTNWIEFNYMYSGSCKQIINGNVHDFHAGQVLLVDSDTIHTVEPLSENDIMIDMIVRKKDINNNFFNRFSNDNFLSQFFINSITENAKHDNYILFTSENSRRLPILMTELMIEWYSPSINAADIILGLFSLIISELVSVYIKDLDKKEYSTSKSSIVSILHYIENNYATCSLTSTADFFNINSDYLSKLLKNRVGFTFNQILQKQKITVAERLLKNSDMSITQIAHYVGYENVSFFYKKFKLQCGCLPGEYRSLHQSES